jgi:ferredoxin
MPKVKVDQNLCIGCGTCISLCPESFKMNDDHKSEPINPPGDPEDKLQEAVQSCPVGAISIEK